MPDPARIDYGNDLASPGQRQPTGAFSIDAFGLAQAQLTFALDSDPENLTAAITYYSAGVAYPDNLGFPMLSYKYAISSAKGGVCMMTVDYMGVFTESGYTYPNMVGVVATQAQPIETHPNFTIITDSSISDNILAGSWDGTHYNEAIFNVNPLAVGTPKATFGGFAVGASGTVNPKAGVRQFLRPATTLRGTMYFNKETQAGAEGLNAAVGKYLVSGDAQTLIPDWIQDQAAGNKWLVTHAGIECIGMPTTIDVEGNYAALKVTFDLMHSGVQGWDQDIYGKAEEIFGS